MSKFTPAPWSISKSCSTAIEAGKRHIASSGGYQSNSVITTPENKANARLIASAPELYDFISSITDASGEYPELNGTQIVSDAYKILAKARGAEA